MFSVEDNILWHCGSCPDHTGSHENLFQGCKTDLITHLKLCNVYSFFPHFSCIFDISINIHEYVNEIVFIKAHDINKFVI